jgi:hypothetical protein
MLRMTVPFAVRRRSVAAIAALLTTFLSVWIAPARADEKAAGPADAQRVAAGKELLAEGDKLADDGKYDDAALTYKAAFEKLLPGMRKLEFKRNVGGKVVPRNELRDILAKIEDEETPPERARAEETGMKALGLIPEDMDLRQFMLRLETEEVGGFYYPKTRTMYLVKEPPPEPGKQKKQGLFEKVFGTGKPKGFDKDETKVVLAHEMTHALADQHFDLRAMFKAAEGDSDRQLALSALVEGEATLTMIGASREDWDGRATAQLPAGRMSLMIGLLTPMLGFTSGPAFRDAPPVLSEQMTFPYLRGLVFCARVTNEGGWDALDAAYRKPPLSTEQVLHPEKYFGEGPDKRPDMPVAIDLGELKPGGGDGAADKADKAGAWKEAERDTLGELTIGIMLRDHNGKAAAAGWGGDTYAAFEGPGGRLGLVWMTTWDTEADARKFARYYTQYQTAKFAAKGKGNGKGKGKGGAGGVPAPDAFSDSVRREYDGAVLVVELRGKDIAVVEGFDAATTDALVDAAFKANKTEKTWDSRPASRKDQH